MNKTISHVTEKGRIIRAYDEKNRMLFETMGELVGYTSTSVTVKKGHNTNYIYSPEGTVKHIN